MHTTGAPPPPHPSICSSVGKPPSMTCPNRSLRSLLGVCNWTKRVGSASGTSKREGSEGGDVNARRKGSPVAVAVAVPTRDYCSAPIYQIRPSQTGGQRGRLNRHTIPFHSIHTLVYASVEGTAYSCLSWGRGSGKGKNTSLRL
ncbi:hypothetical protein AA313_de0208028 [Arthrobotrys entomopaga]|nr:hypothetical protein AA313_de0208028 [Arthrobotrys entomopaga]